MYIYPEIYNIHYTLYNYHDINVYLPRNIQYTLYIIKLPWYKCIFTQKYTIYINNIEYNVLS